jgi:hypothetical protein
MSLYMDQQRREQIEDKISRKQAIDADERAFLQHMYRYQAEQDEKERLKNEGRSDADRERSGAIQEQVHTSVSLLHMSL